MLSINEQQLVNAMIADPDIEKLAKWNQTSSAFDLLSVNEMGHSSLIAWLLNPRDSHELGNYGLRVLLNSCWQEAIEQDRTPDFFDDQYQPLTFNQWNFNNATFLIEHDTNGFGRIDILVLLPANMSRLSLKINSVLVKRKGN